MHSSHIFMFPFRFDYIPKNGDYKTEYDFYKSVSIDDRLAFKHLLDTLNNTNPWHYKPFEPKNLITDKAYRYYNEFAYFYDYAREAIYNLKEFDGKGFYTHEISYYFEHKAFNKDTKRENLYIIQTDKKRYELQIEGVSLRIFATGVAILSFELENHDYGDFADIKAINEYGRRLYPQYLDAKSGTKPGFLPQCITISRRRSNIDETFCLETLMCDHSIKIGDHVMKLLGEALFTQSLHDREKFYIQPIVDDRMFVMSWYGNDSVAEKLKNSYRFSCSWYEYVFVDKEGDCSAQNNMMKKELLKEATYDRWSEYSTLFGMSRYSFVCISGAPFIEIHMRTIYFQMTTLLLAIRTSILRFSDEVAAVAALETQEEEQRLQELYQKYLSFFNRLYFKEVTHQDQGIELYDIGLKQMRIPDHIRKLDSKFSKLFEFANIKQSERESEAMNTLTYLGGIFLIPSLVISILGMDNFESYASKWAVGLSFLLGGVITWIWTRNHNKFWKSIWTLIAVAIYGFIVYICKQNVDPNKVVIENQPISVKIAKTVKEWHHVATQPQNK